MSTKSRTDLKADFTTEAEINQQKFSDLIDASLNLNDDQLNIDAGNVGIGTNSPGHKLQANGPSMMIGGSDHTSAQLKISAQNTEGNGASTSSILMEGYATRAQGIYFTDTGLPEKKWFAGINYFTGFDTYSIGYDADGGSLVQHREKSLLTVKGSTGNVGIGTTSPGATLSVVSDSENIVHLSKTSSSGGDNIFLAFSHSNNTNDNNIRAKIGTNIKTGGHGRLVFHTGSWNNTAERMRIDQEGNVGIGTDIPSAKLDMAGDIKCNNLTQ